ncbi:hypothetical protein DESUT3_16350 [Desulfuromonas versatilis]|uniref:Lipoprotein n=1 Tax=Desulfuromonas versatilis TaxID=2802975 RepID=A0ABN6DX61_9BACT|nr:hypothetical protein [Desulfuromonas versatilis]BCR04566.1 hypothetical protein DESUT3_16350 [Desulfuromonas versatilis]
MNQRVSLSLLLAVSVGLLATGCEKTLRPHLRPEPVEARNRFQPTPTSLVYSLPREKLVPACRKALVSMGFSVEKSAERVTTFERQLDIHRLSRTGGLPGPPLFCTISVDLEQAPPGGNRVTPTAKISAVPNYDPTARVPVDLPGWEMELRREFFDQLAAAL